MNTEIPDRKQGGLPCGLVNVVRDELLNPPGLADPRHCPRRVGEVGVEHAHACASPEPILLHRIEHDTAHGEVGRIADAKPWRVAEPDPGLMRQSCPQPSSVIRSEHRPALIDERMRESSGSIATAAKGRLGRPPLDVRLCHPPPR